MCVNVTDPQYERPVWTDHTVCGGREHTGWCGCKLYPDLAHHSLVKNKPQKWVSSLDLG